MKNISPAMRSLFWTQFFGALNDNLFKSALVLFITYQNVSLFGLSTGSMVALCGGLFIMPFFFVSAMSGQLADKLDKVWLSIKIKEAEVIIALLGALGVIFNHYLLMIFVLFLLGLQSTFFGPIKYSLIPEYADEDQLIYANALVSSGTFIAILLGTIVGGFVTTLSSGKGVLILLLLAVAIVGLRAAKALPQKSNPILKLEKGDIDWNIFRSTSSIIRLVLKNYEVAMLILGLSWFWFMGAGLLSVIPLMAKSTFHANESVATLMLFTFTLGMGLGPFILEKLSRGKVQKFIIPVSLIAMSLFIFDISFVIKEASKNSFFLMLKETLAIKDFFQQELSLRLLTDLFLLSFFGGIFTVIQFAELQKMVDRKELSRIIAGNNVINSLMMVIVSLLLMIFHGMKLSLASIMAIFGILNILMCIALLAYYKDEFNKWWKF